MGLGLGSAEYFIALLVYLGLFGFVLYLVIIKIKKEGIRWGFLQTFLLILTIFIFGS